MPFNFFDKYLAELTRTGWVAASQDWKDFSANKQHFLKSYAEKLRTVFQKADLAEQNKFLDLLKLKKDVGDIDAQAHKELVSYFSNKDASRPKFLSDNVVPLLPDVLPELVGCSRAIAEELTTGITTVPPNERDILAVMDRPILTSMNEKCQKTSRALKAGADSLAEDEFHNLRRLDAKTATDHLATHIANSSAEAVSSLPLSAPFSRLPTEKEKNSLKTALHSAKEIFNEANALQKSGDLPNEKQKAFLMQIKQQLVAQNVEMPQILESLKTIEKEAEMSYYVCAIVEGKEKIHVIGEGAYKVGSPDVLMSKESYSSYDEAVNAMGYDPHSLSREGRVVKDIYIVEASSDIKSKNSAQALSQFLESERAHPGQASWPESLKSYQHFQHGETKRISDVQKNPTYEDPMHKAIFKVQEIKAGIENKWYSGFLKLLEPEATQQKIDALAELEATLIAEYQKPKEQRASLGEILNEWDSKYEISSEGQQNNARSVMRETVIDRRRSFSIFNSAEKPTSTREEIEKLRELDSQGISSPSDSALPKP